jgi:hypothetical protein
LGRLGDSLGRLFGLAKSKGASDMITFLDTLADVLTIIADTLTRVVDSLKVAFPLLRLPQITALLTDYANSQVPPPSPDNGRSNQPRSQGNRTYNINISSTNVTGQQIVDRIRQLERSQGRTYLAR